jgi:hypothetical protein
MKSINHLNSNGEVVEVQIVFESEKERDEYFSYQVADLRRDYQLRLAQIQNQKETALVEITSDASKTS